MKLLQGSVSGLVAAILGLAPAGAATPVPFHPGENLPGLRLDAHGPGGSQIVVSWERGLAAIDAASLAVTELHQGESLGALAATPGVFYYFSHPTGAAGAFPRRLKSLRGLTTATLAEALDSDRTRLAGDRLLFTTLELGQVVGITDGAPEGTFTVAQAPGGGPHCGIFECDELNLPDQLFGTADGRLFYVFEEGPPGDYSYGLYLREAPALYPGLPPQPLPATRRIFLSGAPEKLLALRSDGVLLFAAYDPLEARFRLYGSDGEAGTPWSLPAPGGDLPSAISAESGGVTYLLYQAAGRERELWRTDGRTAAGTYRIRGLGFGDEVMGLWPAGGKIFFGLRTAEEGVELWVSDGSADGTRLLAEGQPGVFWGNPREFRALPDGRMLFTFTDVAHGSEPWISDGTSEGTHLFADLRPGPAGSNARSYVFSPSAGRLFLVADLGAGPTPAFLPFAFGPPPCPDDRLCLRDGRFEVSIAWTAGGRSGIGLRSIANRESGALSFFSADNWEVMVKVLDGCALNQRFWVFAAAATDVHYEIRVFDRWTGRMKSYLHQGGSPSPAITDIDAFASCDASPP